MTFEMARIHTRNCWANTALPRVRHKGIWVPILSEGHAPSRYEPAKPTGSCVCSSSRGRSGDVLEPVRGSVAATRLSKYYLDRAELLGGDMSIEGFEAKWRDVRIDGRKVF